LDNGPMWLAGAVNLKMLHGALPHWPLVTYDSIYDRRVNRLGSMDFCIHQPRKFGFEVLYLTRGVMTFTWPPDAPPMDLQQQWRMSLEDARQHRPDTLWFMGSDARLHGAVCSDRLLPAWGFPDGRAARQRLLHLAGEMGVRLGR
jgi:hypothetical protein